MNVITLKLIQTADCPKLGVGIRVCAKAPTITSLFVADDSLLFYKTNASACCRLKNIMNRFCSLSGHLINFHKSSLVFSNNASAMHKQVVGAIFNIPRKESLGKYLGCPVFQGKPKSLCLLTLLLKPLLKWIGGKLTACQKRVELSLSSPILKPYQLISCNVLNFQNLQPELWTKSIGIFLETFSSG